MGQSTIFIVGLIIFALLIGGVILTILEFRKMGKHPEQYLSPESREDEKVRKMEDVMK